MSLVNFDDCMEAALELVKISGQVIRNAIHKKKTIETKISAVDVVTETDKEVEKLLIKGLQDKFPDHKFIGEESTAAGQKCELTDAPTWIIDPVDGTMNFVHGFPYVSISVALAVNKEVELGIVYGPMLEQLFTARRGKGAFMNGTKLEVSHQQELSLALVIGEVGSDRSEEKLSVMLHNLSSLIRRTHSMRGMGSAALNLCYVAAGYADVYYEYGIHCWDMAAGVLIATEAGGVAIDNEGGKFKLMTRRLICASSLQLAQEISKVLKHLTFESEG